LSSTAALAQAAFSNPDLCEAESANCQVVGPGSWSPNNWGAGARGTRYRRTALHQPAARAAVGPAGTAAPAPYRGWGNSYAAYGGYGGTGWNGDWNSYAARNGIVCRPGTYIKGDDGLRHPCQ
jgi:hypothetical protein